MCTVRRPARRQITERKAAGLAAIHSKLISSLEQLNVLQVNCGSVYFVNLSDITVGLNKKQSAGGYIPFL